MKSLFLLFGLLYGLAGHAQLAAPTLYAPNNGSTNKKVTEYFIWTNITGANYYEIQFDTVNTFNSGFVFSDTSKDNRKFIGELLFGKKHFVRVRAVNAQGSGNWSQIVNFTTLSVPDVLSFTTSQAFVASKIFTYNTGAYLEHELDTSPNFNSPVLKRIHSAHADSTGVVYRDLLFNQNYYFRARSYHNKDTSAWITTRVFTTLGGASLYPLDNNSLEQKYTWTAGYWTGITYPGVSYQLELDTSLDFQSPLFFQMNDTLTTFDDLFSGRYSFGSKWYARVRTFTPADTSDWHMVNFTIFNKPTIINPMATTKDPLPLFTKLGSHPGVHFFLYRLDTTIDFSSTFTLEDTVNNSPLSPSRTLGIPHFARYWYGVRAVSGQDTSEERVVSFQINDGLTVLSPSNNVNNRDVELEFSWTDPKNVSFQLQVDSTLNFTSTPERIYAIPANTSNVEIGELYYGRKNYWRMRAISAVDTGRWMATRNFTTKSSPAPFYPSNNVTDFVKTLDLASDAIHGSDYYEFEIADTSDFSTSWRDTARYDPLWDEVSYPLKRLPLHYLTKYYWRVRAIHSRDTSKWSLTRNFTTADELPKPPQVELVSPADKTTALPVNVTCEWKLIDDVNFWFQLHTDPDFGPGTDSLLIFFIGNVNPTEDLKNLQKGVTFYWRVKAVNDEKDGEWSETWSFSTNPKLTAPKPLYPVGLSDQGTYLSLRWNKIEGASSYRYRIGESSSLAGITPISVPDTFVAIGPLKENTVYYWQVNAQSATEQTTFSTTVFFGTGEGTGVVEVIDGIMLYPNPAKNHVCVGSIVPGEIQWTLYGIDGQCLKQGMSETGECISLEGIPSGLYVIHIDSGGKIGHHRIIKE